MPRFVVAAIIAALIATTAAADPNPQLVRSIELGLVRYGLQADVSQFATTTVVRLHFALHGTEDWIDTRDELRAILRNPVFK